MYCRSAMLSPPTGIFSACYGSVFVPIIRWAIFELLNLFLCGRTNLRLAAVGTGFHFALSLESEMAVLTVIHRHGKRLLLRLCSDIFEKVAARLHRQAQVITEPYHFLELYQHKIDFRVHHFCDAHYIVALFGIL